MKGIDASIPALAAGASCSAATRGAERGPVAAGAWRRRGTHAADIGAEEVADLGGEDVAVAGVGAERHPHPVLGQPGAVCAAGRRGSLRGVGVGGLA